MKTLTLKMIASSSKYDDDNGISTAPSHYWVSSKEFKAQTHKLLDDALEKFGSLEFENATRKTTGDAWKKYMELNKKLRYQRHYLKYAVDPYNIEDNLQFAMYHHNISAFHRIDPLTLTDYESQNLAERTWNFTREFPTVRTELNRKWLQRLKDVKGLQEKLQLFESMEKIFLNECGCESCNNKRKVIIKDYYRFSNCKANAQVNFKVHTGRLAKNSGSGSNNPCHLSTIESYRGVRLAQETNKHTITCEEHSYTNCSSLT